MADRAAQAIWLVLVLLMVGSSLLSRRLPMTRFLFWGALWIAIFLGVYILFTMIGPRIAPG